MSQQHAEDHRKAAGVASGMDTRACRASSSRAFAAIHAACVSWLRVCVLTIAAPAAMPRDIWLAAAACFDRRANMTMEG